MMKRVVAIDQGTTGTKGYTLDMNGCFSLCHSTMHRQIYPQPGYVEHDPEELLQSVLECIESAENICAIGIDNQGETVIAWDSVTGAPIYNAIVWQDQRTLDFIEQLRAGGAEELTLERAGLPLDPYFSASKLRWLMDRAPEAKKLLKKGHLRLGTSESFFLYRLTGVYATDVTTASRTSLMNLRTCGWDQDLCHLFGIPMEILPEIRSTTGYFGSLRLGGRDIPIVCSVVDQQAALFGHNCYENGQGKVTFGTGAFALVNAGKKLRSDRGKGIVSTVAWHLDDEEVIYAMDGAVYSAASAVTWIKNLGLFDDLSEIDRFEASPAISRGLVFVPALSGLACPYWDRSAAGLWIGMSLDTTKADLCQAVLEGIALRTAQVLDAISTLTGKHQRLSVDGGLTNNPYFCQFLADVTQREFVVPASPDITSLGTGRFALLGSGLAKTIPDLPEASPPKTVLSPTKDLSQFRSLFEEAVKRCRNWKGAKIFREVSYERKRVSI